nr:hypothetical protein [Arthrobacter sp. ISL-5]
MALNVPPQRSSSVRRSAYFPRPVALQIVGVCCPVNGEVGQMPQKRTVNVLSGCDQSVMDRPVHSVDHHNQVHIVADLPSALAPEQDCKKSLPALAQQRLPELDRELLTADRLGQQVSDCRRRPAYLQAVRQSDKVRMQVPGNIIYRDGVVRQTVNQDTGSLENPQPQPGLVRSNQWMCGISRATQGHTKT